MSDSTTRCSVEEMGTLPGSEFHRAPDLTIHMGKTAWRIWAWDYQETFETGPEDSKDLDSDLGPVLDQDLGVRDLGDQGLGEGFFSFQCNFKVINVNKT